MVHWTWTSLSFLVQSTWGFVIKFCFFVTSTFGGFVWNLLGHVLRLYWILGHVLRLYWMIGWLDDWMIWLWSQGSKPTWCHTRASTSCWPPMHQSSLQRRHTMSSCQWQRSPCLSSSQPPWWWSVILAMASTWPAAWCTAAAWQKITGGTMFILRKFSAGDILYGIFASVWFCDACGCSFHCRCQYVDRLRTYL